MFVRSVQPWQAALLPTLHSPSLPPGPQATPLSRKMRRRRERATLCLSAFLERRIWSGRSKGIKCQSAFWTANRVAAAVAFGAATGSVVQSGGDYSGLLCKQNALRIAGWRLPLHNCYKCKGCRSAVVTGGDGRCLCARRHDLKDMQNTRWVTSSQVSLGSFVFFFLSTKWAALLRPVGFYSPDGNKNAWGSPEPWRRAGPLKQGKTKPQRDDGGGGGGRRR